VNTQRQPGLRLLMRRAKALGLSVTLTKRGHLKCTLPGGGIAIVAAGGDPRAIWNATGTLNRLAARTRATGEET
jgi:hypothetical protein